MLQLRNNGALTTPVTLAADAVVPFDTTKATNGLVTFNASANAAVVNEPGAYWLFMTVTGIAAAAGEVTLQAYSNGTALPYAAAVGNCDGKNTQSITLAVPVNAVVSAGSAAQIDFRVSAEFAMSNAFGGVQAIV